MNRTEALDVLREEARQFTLKEMGQPGGKSVSIDVYDRDGNHLPTLTIKLLVDGTWEWT